MLKFLNMHLYMHLYMHLSITIMHLLSTITPTMSSMNMLASIMAT